MAAFDHRSPTGTDATGPAGPRLFLLRVWHQPAAFRVALREVCGEGVVQFRSAVELVRYVHGVWRVPEGQDEDLPQSAATPCAAPAPAMTDEGDRPSAPCMAPAAPPDPFSTPAVSGPDQE